MQNQEVQQNEAPASQQGLTETPPPAPIAEPAASQPSNAGSLDSRLVELEQELEKAWLALKDAQESPVVDDGDPVALLESAKKVLVDYDKTEKSQNAKDAIQNINYALAALKREMSAKKG